MGVEAKHSYRFVYLKSEKWKDVRITALLRDEARCRICGERSIHNDAHHIYYPPSVWDTCPDDLVVLCRPCHNFVERIFTLTQDKEKNFYEFSKLVDVVQRWVLERTDAETIKRSDEKQMLAKILPTPTETSCFVCRDSSNAVRTVEMADLIPNPLIKPHRGSLWRLCESCLSAFHTEFDANPPKEKFMRYVADWKLKQRRKMASNRQILTIAG